MKDNPKPRSGVGKLYSRSKSADGVASAVTRPLPTIPGDIVERLDDIIKWVDGNPACIWKDEDVADLRAAKAEIERLHARVAHLDADVTRLSFQHTLDQEEIERLRNSFLVKTESEQETIKRIAWGEGYAVGCVAERALREALEMALKSMQAMRGVIDEAPAETWGVDGMGGEEAHLQMWWPKQKEYLHYADQDIAAVETALSTSNDSGGKRE